MQLLLCSQKKRKVHKPANQASNKLPNQMDSPRRLHDINVQQSRNSIYPSTLISTSLIPPFSTPLSSLSHTHKHISLHLYLSTPHVQLSASQADRMLDPTWEKAGGGGGGDQRDYRYRGRSQICLLNNSNEEQRVQTDEPYNYRHEEKRTTIIGGNRSGGRLWKEMEGVTCGWGIIQ